MKTCRKCRRELPIEQFSKHRKSRGGRLARCKGCVNTARRKNYENPYSSTKSATRFIRDIKLVNGCGKCGLHSKYYAIFEFHHLDEYDKEIELWRVKSVGRAINELKKCVCLCANCHRIAHSLDSEEYLEWVEDIKPIELSLDQ